MKQKAASIILLLTATVWGLAFVAQTLGSQYNGAFTFNASRFLLGATFLIPVAIFAERDHPDRKKRKKTLTASLAGGTVLFVAAALQQYGAGITYDPGKSGFLTGLYIVITPILYFLFFRRRAGVQVWIGIVMATVGLYLLCFDGSFGFRIGKGELLILMSTLFYSLHIVVVDWFVVGASPLKFSCGQFYVCGILNLIFAFLTEEPSWGNIVAGKWTILFCGVFSVAIGYTGQVVGQKLCDNPSRAAIILSTESLFSVIGALLWNLLPIPDSLKVGAEMTGFGILGGFLIFSAILFAQFPQKAKAPESRAE